MRQSGESCGACSRRPWVKRQSRRRGLRMCVWWHRGSDMEFRIRSCPEVIGRLGANGFQMQRHMAGDKIRAPRVCRCANLGLSAASRSGRCCVGSPCLEHLTYAVEVDCGLSIEAARPDPLSESVTEAHCLNIAPKSSLHSWSIQYCCYCCSERRFSDNRQTAIKSSMPFTAKRLRQRFGERVPTYATQVPSDTKSVSIPQYTQVPQQFKLSQPS